MNDTIRCERCGEVLQHARVKWLELDQHSGLYYANIPKGRVSQGAFSFGTTCATKQLKETNEAITRQPAGEKTQP